LTKSAATPISAIPSPPSTATLDTTATRRFPSDLKTIKCSYPNCPKTFNRPARLAAHLRSHTNDRPFKCPFPDCDKDYLEEKHLKQHVKGSHTHERSYACEEPGCGKAFVTATRLRRHAAVHAGKERYRCRGYEGCEQSFRKHQTLQRHVRTEHLGMPAYLCQQEGCGRGFDSAGAMKRHVEREHGELRFWCDECGVADDDEDQGGDQHRQHVGGRGNGNRVGFTTMALLQAHLKKEHVNCIFCDVRCGSQAQLDRHVEMYHSTTSVQDRKTVACEWPGCPKTFTLRKNLNAHVKTAHQGFRFVCGEVDTFGTADIADWNWAEEGCGEGFISKLKLEEHVRFVHLGRKRPKKVYAVGQESDGDYIAVVSGAADAAKRNIPCSVQGCQARFIRHHDLTVHLRNQHGGEGLTFGVRQQVVALPAAAAGYGQQDEVMPPSLGGEQQQLGPREEVPHVPGLEGEVYVDPDLQVGEEFWFGAGGNELQQDAGREFEREWADMRRLIDIDALVDEKPSAF
jgi:general transcription factor IIIA